ncbi:hypothetical protein [Tenacibaculum finnmarkense]|uniref:hypothetical protein n=1 Tax=Tenacibaculum finnmarkense TaxID=2781243 RepID=UPI001EFB5D6E|nr:hypothetical protein [Tenacibaculum finnmarkense]MCG8769619.1 hypothetical protein [Tenacibaculum finnmarkense]MCG8774647.1 hypothetical protein [Tenacibaculum finnmarkense]MCG8871678.1 hypothetical protein [Tenacibaculum finnmarkense]
MMDYIKAPLIGVNTKRLRALPFLHFKGTFDDDTNEIDTKLVAKHHFCTITIYKDESVMFTGSIHKMYNSLKGIIAPNQLKRLAKIDVMPAVTAEQQKAKAKALDSNCKAYKGFNGNNFNHCQIIEVRKYLELLFDCEPHQMKFQNTEFGYNLQMAFASKLFLKGLLHHKGKPFDVRFGSSYQCKHQNYIIKIYNKAIQYGMVGNVLRTEIRVQRASELLKLGITSFSDINTTTLKKATELLQKRLNEVVYFDYTIDTKTFGTIDKRKYLEYQIANFFIDKDKEGRKYPTGQLQCFIDKYSTNIKAQILKKVDNLFALNTWFYNLEIQAKCSGFSYDKNQQIKNQKFTLNTSSSINVNRAKNTIENQPQNQPPKPLKKEPRICIITGVNISTQKEDSFLLSHTGIKHLLKTDFSQFEKIRNKFIYPKFRFSDIEIQIKEIAHSIRDKNVIRKRNYNNNQTSIF